MKQRHPPVPAGLWAAGWGSHPRQAQPLPPGTAVRTGRWDAEGSRGPAGRVHGTGTRGPRLLSPASPGSLPRPGITNPPGFACSCWIYRLIPARHIPTPGDSRGFLQGETRHCQNCCNTAASSALRATSRPSWRAAGSFPLPSRNAGAGTVGGNRILRAGGWRVLRPLALPEGSELGKGLCCPGAPRAPPLARTERLSSGRLLHACCAPTKSRCYLLSRE